jgi:hypothetical protein
VSEARPFDTEDRDRVAARVRRDQLSTVVDQREAALARKGIRDRARGRSAFLVRRVAARERDGPVGRTPVAEDLVPPRGVGLDEERVAVRMEVAVWRGTRDAA